MARKRPTAQSAFVLFDVVYQDGTRSSNRKVPGELVGTLDGDDPVRGFIEEQDRTIAQRSGTPRGPIKTLSRSLTR
jgi:hypothetical protein